MGIFSNCLFCVAQDYISRVIRISINLGILKTVHAGSTQESFIVKWTLDVGLDQVDG